MGGPRFCIAITALAWMAAACGDQGSDVPTTPSFARPVQNGCDFSAISNLVKTEFGPSSNESKLATAMKNYGAKSGQATYVGYQLLDAIGVKYEIAANQLSTTVASQLAVALPPCMNVGSADIPTSFETELGPTGAFAVRGWPEDARPVESHDEDAHWILEPPSGQDWEDITVLGTTGLPDSVKHLFLAYGTPVSSGGFTNDQLVGNVFNWNTIPTAEFTGSGVVVGECSQESNYIQHNAANDGPEVLGFVAPSCAVFDETAAEREPRTFAERLIRLLGPKPLFATLKTTTGTGGSKSNLSPFGLVYPGLVNLDPLFNWKKSGNKVGVPFDPTPKYQILSAAGTEFKQDYVFIWLEAIGNSGTNVAICNNWAYTNAVGIAQFPQAFLNKAGGYTIIARTSGTVSKPDVVEDGEAPSVPPGSSVTSPLINVKNGTLGTCANTFTPGDDLPDPPGPNGFAEINP